MKTTTCGEGAVKRWLPDTKWETGRNWQSGKPPCAGQRASLGHAHGLSIYLGSEVQLGALVFPKTGELVLDEGAALSFESFETDEDCVGEAQFTAQERVHWYNPGHWALRQSSQLLPEPVENRPDTEPRPPAVPDSEMVPCPSDFVVFEDERFRIYGGPEMSSLLSSEEGKSMFSGVVTSGSSDCKEPEGCACGNDQPEPLERICLQHAPLCAENLPCQDSIVMIGNCCPICGGSVAGIVLGVLFALLLLAGAIYVIYRRYGFRHPRTLFRGRPLLPMARFDDGRIELELGTTPHDALVPSGDEPSFENPLAGPFEVTDDYCVTYVVSF
ncbi:hypothetical protein HPB52_006168 [Rhipicephalus sanguineus]|uniref:Protein amnionless n=1 Tax=Rhipicephalus sanguineus TaxID=34632 RepID=A0A9D4T5H1_RHISA|nr:hypothetical protein HPB52_006168 [Rhipicephalus sanguineus]